MVMSEPPSRAAQQQATIRAVVPAKAGGYVISYPATALDLARFKNGDIPQATSAAVPVVMLAPGCAWIRQTSILPTLGLTESELAAGQIDQTFDAELLWQQT